MLSSKRTRYIPVIMLTGEQGEDAKNKANHAYADGYVIKPIDAEGQKNFVLSYAFQQKPNILAYFLIIIYYQYLMHLLLSFLTEYYTNSTSCSRIMLPKFFSLFSINLWGKPLQIAFLVVGYSLQIALLDVVDEEFGARL
ncbi:hypothetical protein ACFLS1_12710, partial [Verrucomicrobiota bacterium]